VLYNLRIERVTLLYNLLSEFSSIQSKAYVIDVVFKAITQGLHLSYVISHSIEIEGFKWEELYCSGVKWAPFIPFGRPDY
jgi:hypothetical protein